MIAGDDLGEHLPKLLHRDDGVLRRIIVELAHQRDIQVAPCRRSRRIICRVPAQDDPGVDVQRDRHRRHAHGKAAHGIEDEDHGKWGVVELDVLEEAHRFLRDDAAAIALLPCTLPIGDAHGLSTARALELHREDAPGAHLDPLGVARRIHRAFEVQDLELLAAAIAVHVVVHLVEEGVHGLTRLGVEAHGPAPDDRQHDAVDPPTPRAHAFVRGEVPRPPVTVRAARLNPLAEGRVAGKTAKPAFQVFHVEVACVPFGNGPSGQRAAFDLGVVPGTKRLLAQVVPRIAGLIG